MAFSKSLQKGQIPVGCQLCDGGNRIEWKCTDCNLLMCDRCKDKVHLRIAKDHRTVNIQEIREYEDSWDSFVFSEVRCPDHPNHMCSLYCGTCSKVICLKCIIKVHNGHTFVDEEEFENKKKNLKEEQKKVESYLSKLSSTKEKMMAPEETECQKLKKLRQNIADQKKKLHKVVDEYAGVLVQDVDQHFRSLKRKQETKIKNYMHLKNDTLGSIITSRDFRKFFRDFEKLNVSFKEDMSLETTSTLSLPSFIPGEFKLINFGSLEGILRENRSQIQFKVTNQWSTKLTDIHYIARCLDGTLWIADGSIKVLQNIKLKTDNVKVLSNFSIKIFGLIIDMHNNILVSSLDTQLKTIHGRTQEVTGSVFNIAPFITCNIHTTQDKKVLISAKSPVPGGRCKVIVMDQAGNRLTEYENDSNNKPLFTFAYMLTSTSKGHICIIDKLDVDFRGRVLVIGQGGTIKGIYTGHADVNTGDNPFTPLDILATPSDNILIADSKISVIHILNSDGNFISFFSAYDIGIQYPHSLALSTPGKLYIGCGSGVESPEHYEAKLYEVEYSGM